MCRSEQDTRNESPLRKFMNVNDMQVPDENDRVAAQPPPHDQSEEQDRDRANLRGKPCLSNKIVTEHVWINPVTSKSMPQPLDTDTDARLHEEKVISMRKHAESASRVLHENIPDEMKTSWKLLVDVMSKSFRKRSRLPDLEQTAAQSPGAVNADLEQREAQSPGFLLQISSRRA